MIPITIFTGFLGSGKTTLLNRILKNPKLQDSAVIINEYGEVGVDHLFVEKVASELIEISSGCVCCTVRGELLSVLEKFETELNRNSTNKFKRIIIETTGLADPTLVVRAIMQNPNLSRQFQVENIVACLDSVNGAQVLASNIEAVKQITLADQIVLTKSDLLETTLKQGIADHSLFESLKNINPVAQIYDCTSSNFDVEALVGQFDEKIKSGTNDNLNWIRKFKNVDSISSQKTINGNESNSINKTDSVHQSSIQTFTLTTNNFIAANMLENFLDVLGSTVGSKILRIKGLVGITEKPGQPAIVQGVQNFMHPIENLESWPGEKHTTFLVFIALAQIEETARRTFNAFFRIPAVDSPDQMAITENPLAIAGFA